MPHEPHPVQLVDGLDVRVHREHGRRRGAGRRWAAGCGCGGASA
jgi:hypothetical protein